MGRQVDGIGVKRESEPERLPLGVRLIPGDETMI